MRSRTVVIDAGPLVAFFIRRDAYHVWSLEQFKAHPPPFQTCEAVLTEAEHILERIDPRSVEKFRDFLERGLIEIGFSLGMDLTPVLRLQRRYQDLPMSLADACLVRMAELDPDVSVLTTDGDFRVYRKGNRQVIPLIFPYQR
jgi:predicted nucleic acid-binding protein